MDSLFLDCVREVRPPFSPEQVTAEFAGTLKSYRVTKVIGDRYAGEWPREQFRKYGISYELAEKPKSDLYRDLLPLLNSRRVELLDHPRLLTQLVGLERRVSRAGKDSIDHAPGSHDDIANAAAGALLAAASISKARITFRALSPDYGPLRNNPMYEMTPAGPRIVEEEPRSRVRFVNIAEADAPAVRWPYPKSSY